MWPHTEFSAHFGSSVLAEDDSSVLCGTDNTDNIIGLMREVAYVDSVAIDPGRRYSMNGDVPAAYLASLLERVFTEGGLGLTVELRQFRKGSPKRFDTCLDYWIRVVDSGEHPASSTTAAVEEIVQQGYFSVLPSALFYGAGPGAVLLTVIGQSAGYQHITTFRVAPPMDLNPHRYHAFPLLIRRARALLSGKSCDAPTQPAFAPKQTAFVLPTDATPEISAKRLIDNLHQVFSLDHRHLFTVGQAGNTFTFRAIPCPKSAHYLIDRLLGMFPGYFVSVVGSKYLEQHPGSQVATVCFLGSPDQVFHLSFDKE